MSEERDPPPASAYVVRNFEHEGKKKAQWLRVGAAWPHKDHDGFNIVIAEGISVSGRLIVRKNKENEESGS